MLLSAKAEDQPVTALTGVTLGPRVGILVKILPPQNKRPVALSITTDSVDVVHLKVSCSISLMKYGCFTLREFKNAPLLIYKFKNDKRYFGCQTYFNGFPETKSLIWKISRLVPLQRFFIVQESANLYKLIIIPTYSMKANESSAVNGLLSSTKREKHL